MIIIEENYKHLINEGFEHFIVYSDGRVKNTISGKFINGDINNCGYHRVQLYSNKKRLRFFRHRLVAFYFVDGYVEGLVVNHIDGKKENNHHLNLEWITKSQNEIHKYNILNAKKTNKSIKIIYCNGNEYIFNDQYEMAEHLNIKVGTLNMWINKKIPQKHKDLIKCFEFVK